MAEVGRIIVLIQNRDESSARGTTCRGPTILSHHNELVAGLKFTVQGKFCAYLTFKRVGQMEKHGKGVRNYSTAAENVSGRRHRWHILTSPRGSPTVSMLPEVWSCVMSSMVNSPQ